METILWFPSTLPFLSELPYLSKSSAKATKGESVNENLCLCSSQGILGV